MKKITAITVCVNYDDLLQITLQQNHIFFDKWYIITSKEDTSTLEVIQKYNYSNIVVLFYDFKTGGKVFNKGGAIRMCQDMLLSKLDENVRPGKEGVRREWNGEKMEYDLIPTKEPHSFDKPHDGVVVAYMRDRKEKDVEAHPFQGKAPNKKFSEEYDYLFVESENKWYVRDNHKSRPKFVELTEKVCEKN